MGQYQRQDAWRYAMRYGINPNPNYIYFEDDDCTNFVSQCLRAGGAQNHYHPTHPWWYLDGKMSLSWSVASSLYWYIRVSTEEDESGIRAQTFFQSTSRPLKQDILDAIQPADLIQYRDAGGVVRHSSIITGFGYDDNGEFGPLVTQHTSNAVNISWRKGHFTTAIFHHIIGINSAE